MFIFILILMIISQTKWMIKELMEKKELTKYIEWFHKEDIITTSLLMVKHLSIIMQLQL